MTGEELGSRIRYFGEHWTAPMLEGAEQIDTPVGSYCIGCQETIEEGDQGIQYVNGPYEHKECSLRSVMGGIGHLVNHSRYCGIEGFGPDAGLNRRVSARLVWNWYTKGEKVTEEQLTEMRGEQVEV